MASRRPLIARGERAPDFALPVDGQEGATRYYGLVGGRPAVLVLAGERPGGAVRDLLARLPALVATDLDVHVVVAGSPPGQSATSDLPAGTFHDPGGQVHEAYGVTLEDAPVVVVLDPNVRVLGAMPVGDVEATLADVADTVPAPRDDDGEPAPRLAPVLLVPDALDGDLREELMARWETEGAVETGVETVVEGERAEATDVRRKRRRDLVITTEGCSATSPSTSAHGSSPSLRRRSRSAPAASRASRSAATPLRTAATSRPTATTSAPAPPTAGSGSPSTSTTTTPVASCASPSTGRPASGRPRGRRWCSPGRICTRCYRWSGPGGSCCCRSCSHATPVPDRFPREAPHPSGRPRVTPAHVPAPAQGMTTRSVARAPADEGA